MGSTTENQKSAISKIFRKPVRLILVAAGALLALVIVWFLANRITAPGRRIRQYRIDGIAAAANTDKTSGSLRVMTYNIAHGRGNTDSNWAGGSGAERARRLDAISDMIRKSGPDIVVLNEVDFSCRWSGAVNQARHIARRAGFPYVIEEINHDLWLPFFRLRFGNAILSRYPLSNAKLLDLPAYSWIENLLIGKKRGVTATVETGGGGKYVIFALHLEHRCEKTRCESIDVVVKAAAAFDESKYSVLIAGDMNSTFPGFPLAEGNSADNNAMARLKSLKRFRFHPESASAKSDYTYPAHAPRQVIDWIIIPESHAFSSYGTVKSSLSDHLPVIAGIKR